MFCRTKYSGNLFDDIEDIIVIMLSNTYNYDIREELSPIIKKLLVSFMLR